MAIYTNPNRGSHEAYAVTLNGVFYMRRLDRLGRQRRPGSTSPATWPRSSTTRSATPTLGRDRPRLGATTGATGQYGGFRSIVADYRYAIPDPANAGARTYPVLYVSGYGGVFRSLDNGQTWTVFPNTAFDAAPVDGGYLPSVDVTNLQLNLGAINPATGHADPGRRRPRGPAGHHLRPGRLRHPAGPRRLPQHRSASTPTLPAPGGSDSGPLRHRPDHQRPHAVHRRHQRDLQLRQHRHDHPDRPDAPATARSSGTGTTDAFGQFSIQIVNDGDRPVFFLTAPRLDDKVVGIQATDSSGAKGNVTTFTYTLKHHPAGDARRRRPGAGLRHRPVQHRRPDQPLDPARRPPASP